MLATVLDATMAMHPSEYKPWYLKARKHATIYVDGVQNELVERFDCLGEFPRQIAMGMTVQAFTIECNTGCKVRVPKDETGNATNIGLG